MQHNCYIIYSKSKDSYYVGSTSVPLQDRIRRHNANHKGYTGKASDWELKWNASFETKSEALHKEKTIKGWKSRKMIEKLLLSASDEST